MNQPAALEDELNIPDPASWPPDPKIGKVCRELIAQTRGSPAAPSPSVLGSPR